MSVGNWVLARTLAIEQDSEPCRSVLVSPAGNMRLGAGSSNCPTTRARLLYKPGPEGGQVSLALGLPRGNESPAAAEDVRRVRELLNLPAGTEPYTITYGNSASAERNIPMVTRSGLAILSDLGAEMNVPQADVTNGRTKPAIELVGGETRPIVLIHSAKKINGYASGSLRQLAGCVH